MQRPTQYQPQFWGWTTTTDKIFAKKFSGKIKRSGESQNLTTSPKHKVWHGTTNWASKKHQLVHKKTLNIFYVENNIICIFSFDFSETKLYIIFCMIFVFYINS